MEVCLGSKGERAQKLGRVDLLEFARHLSSQSQELLKKVSRHHLYLYFVPVHDQSIYCALELEVKVEEKSNEESKRSSPIKACPKKSRRGRTLIYAHSSSEEEKNENHRVLGKRRWR